MSMMHGRDTMMIELIQVTRIEGGIPNTKREKIKLVKREARPPIAA